MEEASKSPGPAPSSPAGFAVGLINDVEEMFSPNDLLLEFESWFESRVGGQKARANLTKRKLLHYSKKFEALK